MERKGSIPRVGASCCWQMDFAWKSIVRPGMQMIHSSQVDLTRWETQREQNSVFWLHTWPCQALIHNQWWFKKLLGWLEFVVHMATDNTIRSAWRFAFAYSLLYFRSVWSWKKEGIVIKWVTCSLCMHTLAFPTSTTHVFLIIWIWPFFPCGYDS